MGGRIEGEGPRGEPTSQQSKPEQTQPLQGRAEGRQSLQGPTTVDRTEQLPSSRDLSITPQEQPTPQQESTLSRAVESTRDLYEQNGWVFLPLAEAGKASPTLPSPQTEHTPQQEQSKPRRRRGGGAL